MPEATVTFSPAMPYNRGRCISCGLPEAEHGEPCLIRSIGGADEYGVGFLAQFDGQPFTTSDPGLISYLRNDYEFRPLAEVLA